MVVLHGPAEEAAAAVARLAAVVGVPAGLAVHAHGALVAVVVIRCSGGFVWDFGDLGRGKRGGWRLGYEVGCGWVEVLPLRAGIVVRFLRLLLLRRLCCCCCREITEGSLNLLAELEQIVLVQFQGWILTNTHSDEIIHVQLNTGFQRMRNRCDWAYLRKTIILHD